MARLHGPLLAVAALLCILLGAGTGVASIAVHEKSWPWFVVAVAAPVATSLALRPGWVRSGFAAGWIGVLFLAVQGRPEGDYVVMSTLRGYLLLGFALAMILLVVVTLPVRSRAVESEDVPSGT